MQKHVKFLLCIWLLAACTLGPQLSRPAAPTASGLPAASPLSNSPAPSAETLSEIIWVSDPGLPQYDPHSSAYADFPNVINQISEMGAGAIDAADDLAVAIRYPRQDAYLAAQALLKLGPDITATTFPLLRDNLLNEKSGTRIYSLILFASVGERASCAVDEIAPLLWDADPRVRSATAQALEKITAQDLVERDDEVLITPAFLADSIPDDAPEGQVVEKARHWWNETGSKINWHPSYGICDP